MRFAGDGKRAMPLTLIARHTSSRSAAFAARTSDGPAASWSWRRAIGGSPEKDRHIIIPVRTVAAPDLASGALVQDDEPPALVQERNRLHQRATKPSSVAGIDVDVHRPQAVRTVVGVAIPGDQLAAVRTTEVLACAREAPRQRAPRFVEPDGAARGRSVWGSPSWARASSRRSCYLLVRDCTPPSRPREADCVPDRSAA